MGRAGRAGSSGRSRVRLRAWALVSPTASAASASVRSGRRIARRTLATSLGLGLGQGQAVEDQRLAVLELGEQGHADRGPDRLLGHRVAVVSVAAGEGHAAALALVGPLGAGAGVAGPLLAEQLLARAGDVGPAAGVDRADPPRRQVHQHHVVQQLLVDLAAEVGRVDRLLADLLAGGVVDRYRQHGSIHSRFTGRSRLSPARRCLLRVSHLVRLPDGEVAAVGAGHGPLDQEQVVGRVDPHDLEVADRDPGVADAAPACGCPSGCGPGRRWGPRSRGGGASA